MSGPVYKVGDPAPPPLPRRSETEVMARWKGAKPVVSILCPTYQHVDFIEDALRGFLGQDTDFPFEILVRDDASTDGTAEIVRDYADFYPNIIRAVLETENRWPEVKPLQALESMSQGEFVAICEGDDYWISANKMQRQRDALVHSPTSAASHHGSLIIQDGTVAQSVEKNRIMRSLTDLELKTWAMIPIRTVMYRKIDERIEVSGISGDKLLSRSFGLHGGSTFIGPDCWSVYRRHPGSWTEQTPMTLEWRRDIPLRHRRLAKEFFVRGEYVASGYWMHKSVRAFGRRQLADAWRKWGK